MTDRRRGGNATKGALLVLLMLAGAGVWNYNRNLQNEQAMQATRPYESYATADLESLRAAYAADLEGVRAEFAHSKAQRNAVARDTGSMARNIEQFTNTANASSAIRAAADEVVERESQVAELDLELERRDLYGQGNVRHFKLLLKIDDLITF